MNKKEITCIICPIGCKIIVNMNGTKIDVIDGYKCKRGIEYANSEALDPKRVLTSTILVKNGNWPLVSVKTKKPVPKEKIPSVLKEIKKMKLTAPIKSGQTLIKNVANTNIDVIATRSID